MEKPLKIRLHVLSPIHIGCDDVYEPTSFVIDENKKKLIEFDPIDFITHLTQEQRNEFMRVCSSDNLLSIFKFVRRVFNNNIPAREVDVASGLIEHYKNVLAMSSYDKKIIINQFILNKTAYNPQTNSVYIPGSSIKGSLRTAYLSYLAVKKDKKNVRMNAIDFEKELLEGSFDTDPFRMVKVSDFQPLENVRTKIVYGINKKKRISSRETRASSGPLQIFEVLERGSIFEGIINIDEPLRDTNIKSPIYQTTLFNACSYHYGKIFKEEMHVVNKFGFNNILLGDFKDRLNKTCFLVRIGRHSGAEAVTIEGNRSYSTAIWLASETARPRVNNGLTPFGWAIMEIIPFDEKEGLFPIKKQETKEISFQEKEREASKSVREKHIEPESTVDVATPEPITWPGAYITYSPGNKTLVASYENKKAEKRIGDDKSFVPEKFHKNLFEKRKSIRANITVEPLGNAFEIIKIEEN